MAPLPASALMEAMRAVWDDRRLKQGGTAYLTPLTISMVGGFFDP